MGKHKDYSDGSRRSDIIKALLITGVIPLKSAVFFPAPKEMTRRLLKKMVMEGVLLERKTAKGRKYVVLKPMDQLPVEVLENIPEIYLDYYSATGSMLRQNAMERRNIGNEQERALDSADAFLFYRGLPAECDPGEKPYLLGDTEGILNRRCYYTSREIKSVPGLYMDLVKEEKETDGRVSKQILGSRISGIYLPGNRSCYMVYDLGKHSIYWQKNAETNMIRHTERMLKELGFPDHSVQAAVFLYSGAKVLRTVYNQKNRPGMLRPYLSVDLLYSHMYFIPQDKDGQALMKAMSLENWEYRFRSLFLTDDEIRAGGTEYDGLNTETGIIYDIFCIPDLARLKLFLMRAKDPAHFIIYAFTFQRDFLTEIADENLVTIRYADFQDFKKEFLKGDTDEDKD